MGSISICGIAIMALASSLGDAPFTAMPSGPALQDREQTLGILDITMAGEDVEVDNWAVGLADFMAAVLHEHRVPLLERAELRYVLSERRLRQEGFVLPEDVIRNRLPWVKFLLRGEVLKEDETRFRIEISIARATDGTLAGRLEDRGVYPDDVPVALERLARQIAGITAIPVMDRSPKPVPGFTRLPEIALLFYKGVDHLNSGRPELASEYFRLAAERDEAFVVAGLWRMKAYQALGLNDFSEVVLRLMQQEPAQADLLRRVESITTAGRQQWTVCLSMRHPAAPAALEEALRLALAERAEISIVSPDWIRELAAEMDLSITGEFEPHMLLRRVWLPVDLVLSLDIAEEDDGPGLRILALDAASGEILHELPVPRSAASWPEACRRLIALLLDGQERGSAESATAIRRLAPLNYAPARNSQPLHYHLQTYAHHLRAFADDPCNPRKLTNAYEWIRFQLPDREGDWRAKSWPMLELLIDRLLACIPWDDVPDAPNWLSHALWSRWYAGSFSVYGSRTPSEVPPVTSQEAFEPLISCHPESFAAFAARYAIAYEHMVHGRHAQAAPLFESLCLESDEWNDLVPVWRCQLYHYTSRELLALGRRDEARKYIKMAYDALMALEARGGNERAVMDRRAEMVSTPVLYAVVWNPRLSDRDGWHLDQLLLFRSWLPRSSDRQLVGKEILRLHSEFFSRPGDVSLPLDQTLRLLREAPKGISTRQQVQARREAAGAYLREMIRHARAGEPFPREHIYMIEDAARTLLQSSPASSIGSAGRLVDHLAVALRDTRGTNEVPPYIIVNVFVMHENYDALLGMAEGLLVSGKMDERQLGVIIKEQVLGRRGEHPERIRFLTEQLSQLDPVFQAQSHNFMIHSYQLAAALRNSDQLAGAASVHRRVLDLLDQQDNKDDSILRETVCLYYHLAELEVMMGDIPAATELFRRVAEMAEDKQWLLFIEHDDRQFYTSGRISAPPPDVHARAVQRLDALRLAAAGADSENASSPVTDPRHSSDMLLWLKGSRSSIRGFRVHEEYQDRLVLDIDYEYAGEWGERATIVAGCMNMWDRSPDSLRRSEEIAPGEGTVRVTLAVSPQRFHFEPILTNYLFLGISDDRRYIRWERRFPYRKTWSWRQQSNQTTARPATRPARSSPATPAGAPPDG